MENILAVFEKYDDEFLKFRRVENKLSNRPDLHAFILLDQLLPGTSDIVSAAEHDEIFLDIDLESLAKSGITEEQVCDLVRCGCRVSDFDSLCLFV